jgi:hypothetical protein
MRQMPRALGDIGVQKKLKIFPEICENLKRFLKCSSKMSYFGLKSLILFKNCEWGMVYIKIKGRKKSLEGCMQPAGCTFAMSGI